MRELIQDRELASSHHLEQTRHVRMLEKQAAWKRKAGFDRIEIIVEMHEHTLRRLHTVFYSEPLYTGLYNPRWPPTAEEFTADMNDKVGDLRLEIPLVQLPPPPQNDLSPRRSPAAGTELDEPEVSHTVTQQTEQERTFPFQAGTDGFLHVSCIPVQERTISFQAEVGVNPEITTVQVTAVRETADWPATVREAASIEQTK